MKSVLMSIRPQWCELIASGKKTVEVRKTRPKLETPFKVYIYCTNSKAMLWILRENERDGQKISSIFTAKDCGGATKANGKVIGEFVCEKIDRIAHCGTCNNDIRLRLVDKDFAFKELDWSYLDSCKLSYPDIDEYSNGRDVYGWHISDLVIYDKPKELREFIRICPEWEKGEITEKCLECEHLYRSPIENFIECDYEGELPITRPPQSWCYVEEVKDNG